MHTYTFCNLLLHFHVNRQKARKYLVAATFVIICWQDLQACKCLAEK
jgi:hypothetical protein